MRFGAFDFTLRQLQYLLAVAEAGSFRRAAQLCHVSQPSLSAQVAEAERALGVQVFERGRGGVRITPAGAAVLERAALVVVAADDVAATARHGEDPLQGALRLGVIPTIAPYLLPTLHPALRAAFPRLDLRWTEDRTATLVEAIEVGELDGAVVALEAELGQLESAVLGRDAFFFAAARSHRLAVVPGVLTLDALEQTEVLLLADGHCLGEQALALCAAHGARDMDFRATSLATLVQMVAAGDAATLLPEMSLEVENRHGQLVIRPFADPPHRTIALAWRRGSALEPALREIAAVGMAAVAS